MKPKEHIAFPEGADRDLLKRFSKKVMVEREKRFERNHNALLRRAKIFAKKGEVDEDAKKALADHLRLVQSLGSQERQPKFVPLSGHNPARYAPFEFSSSFINCAGQGAYDICELRGPDATTGQIGANLNNLASFADKTDTMSAISSVGFWYYASVTGTLHVTAQANLSGRAFSSSGETYAGLELSVEHFLRLRSPYHATTDIFRSGVTAFHLPWAVNDRVYVLAQGHFPSWEGRTVSVLAPVRRFNWYLITVNALQHVICDGISDFDIYVGPISYFFV